MKEDINKVFAELVVEERRTAISPKLTAVQEILDALGYDVIFVKREVQEQLIG